MNLNNLNFQSKNIFDSNVSNILNSSEQINLNLDNNNKTNNIFDEEKYNKERFNYLFYSYNSKNSEFMSIKKELDEEVNKLIDLKITEKKAYNLIRDNEYISNQIFNDQKTLIKYKEKEARVKKKEDRLYYNLKREIKLYGNNKDNSLYFRK